MATVFLNRINEPISEAIAHQLSKTVIHSRRHAEEEAEDQQENTDSSKSANKPTYQVSGSLYKVPASEEEMAQKKVYKVPAFVTAVVEVRFFLRVLEGRILQRRR